MALVDNDIMVLGNASMDMYDKCGRFGTTKEVMDNMDKVTKHSIHLNKYKAWAFL